MGIGKAIGRAGRAAESLAADTGRTMAAIREDVKEVKDRLLKEMWPRVNDTLADVQALVRETQTFVSTGTFTFKIVGLFFIVCILYLLKKQLTSMQWRKNAYWHRARAGSRSSVGAVVLAMEGILLHFIFWTCLLMAVVLAIHLVQQVFLVAKVGRIWPSNVPFIVIIPSIATVAVILQYIGEIIHFIASAFVLMIYIVLGLPLNLSLGPAVNGKKYARTSSLLLLVVLTTYSFLYLAIAAFPLLYLWKVSQLKLSLLEFALLVYLVFFATAIAISIVGEVVLKVFIRPLWAFWARMMRIHAHHD